ncbi:MAG: alpha/beta hydrolase [Acholeplasmatales bacterium]|nr:alpha/beta hydrolase [Acholeplasmatales bacterium]
MKKALIISGGIVGFILSIILILLLTWVLMSPGKIRKYKGENSLSEKIKVDINGVKNGFFINSVDINNPVLLLVSSGPGTDDYFLTEKYKKMNLEEYYTVVYWDYRGMGIVYDKDININEITLDTLINDTHLVTNYLKERFNKDKIFIMGFSGGSIIALNTVKEYPTDYYAYIGMAQVVTDSFERDTLMYNFMKDKFKNSKKNLRRLENAIIHLEDGNVKCKDFGEFVYLVHDAGGGTILNKNELKGITLPIILSRCYTIKEKINYIKGKKLYDKTPLVLNNKDYDYRTSINNLDVPVYFISGESDYNCPVDLVEDYANILGASFYKIKDAAHSPLWENPEEVIPIFENIKEECLK